MSLRRRLVWVWIATSAGWFAIMGIIVYQEREYLFRSCAADQPPDCRYGPLDTYVALFALGAAVIPPLAVYLLGECAGWVWRWLARR
jgi:hypothetical protein